MCKSICSQCVNFQRITNTANTSEPGICELDGVIVHGIGNYGCTSYTPSKNDPIETERYVLNMIAGRRIL